MTQPHKTYYEIDISILGYREMEIIASLLAAYTHDPQERDITTIRIYVNSGQVFLINENNEMFGMYGDQLTEWYTCPKCGCEGFISEFEFNPCNNQPYCPICHYNE